MSAHAVFLTDRLASTFNYVPLLGGILNKVVSPGLTTLQAWMVGQGISTDMHGATEWDRLADPLHKMKWENPDIKLIVVGYSLGGMRACDLCNLLAQPKHSVEIDLLVTLVPPMRLISWNVKRAVNHTVKGDHWNSDYIYRATADGKVVTEDGITNVNHSFVPGVTHYAIQAFPQVHASIHSAVLETIGGSNES